jgi:hypothetical protein
MINNSFLLASNYGNLGLVIFGIPMLGIWLGAVVGPAIWSLRSSDRSRSHGAMTIGCAAFVWPKLFVLLSTVSSWNHAHLIALSLVIVMVLCRHWLPAGFAFAVFVASILLIAVGITLSALHGDFIRVNKQGGLGLLWIFIVGWLFASMAIASAIIRQLWSRKIDPAIDIGPQSATSSIVDSRNPYSPPVDY